jgi:hypothetical protein
MINIERNYKVVGQAEFDEYDETEQADFTSRLLDRSRDCGAYAEMVGRGKLFGYLPVKAVYLLDKDDCEDENFDHVLWEDKLARFEIED